MNEKVQPMPVPILLLLVVIRRVAQSIVYKKQHQ